MSDNTLIRRARLASAAQTSHSPLDGTDNELQIQHVRAWALREPVGGRSYTVIRLETRSGLIGYGECAVLSATELDGATRVIVGRPATTFEVTAPLLAEFPAARAALNSAMLDIVGKATKAPIYQVLGGPTRYKARALATLAGDSDAELVGSLQQAKAAGFRAFLVPVPPTAHRNHGQAYVLAVKKRLEALRTAGGADSDLVLDGGNRLTPGDAQMVSSAIERFHVLWFNEPCPPMSLGALKKIAGECVTPIGIGRHLRAESEVQDLLREDAVDILRPEMGRHGISQIRRMASVAETYYVAIGPTHEGGPIGTAAALHLAAAIPNFYIQQIPRPEAEADRRMRSELTSATVEVIRDGFVDLPVGPGLGITVNEQVLDKYRENRG